MAAEADDFTDEDCEKRNQILSEFTIGYWSVDFGRTGSWAQHLTRLSKTRFVLTLRLEDPTDRAQSVRWFRVMMENTSEEGAISNARGFYQRMPDLRENEFCDRQGREELRGHLTASEFWDKLFPDTIAT
jgi:hypothetical protein